MNRAGCMGLYYAKYHQAYFDTLANGRAGEMIVHGFQYLGGGLWYDPITDEVLPEHEANGRADARTKRRDLDRYVINKCDSELYVAA